MVDLIAYYPGHVGYLCARRNGQDVIGIRMVQEAHALDGGTVTVMLHGMSCEYPVDGWIAYVEGDAASVTPISVQAPVAVTR